MPNVPKKHMTAAERERHLASRVTRQHDTKKRGDTRAQFDDKKLARIMTLETRKRVMDHAGVKRTTDEARAELAREADRFLTTLANHIAVFMHSTGRKTVRPRDVDEVARKIMK